MQLGELYDRVILALDEDWDDPVFWKKWELFTYMKDGINDIIKNSNLVLNERTIPIVPRIDNGELVEGSFSIPDTILSNNFNIHMINAIYWKHKVGGKVQDIKLNIAMPYEMDHDFPNWRNRDCQVGEHPTHAILSGGNVADYGDASENFMNGLDVSRFGKPKIILYPKPLLTNEMRIDLDEELKQILSDFNNSGEDIDLGVVIDDDVNEDMLLNLEDDGGNTIGSNAGQEDLSWIVRYEQAVVETMIGVLPFVLYKPKFDIPFTDDDEWRTCDLSFLPDEEILNVVNYVEHIAYKKSGDSDDLQRSMLNNNIYQEKTADSRSKKVVFQRTRLNRCRFFK